MTLRTFNNILSLLVVVLIGYVLISPFTANVAFWWKQQHDPNHGYVYKSKVNKKSTAPSLKAIPSDNRLVIPQMQLDAAIHEGSHPYTLSKGLWHRPGTGSPTSGGNMVIAGHRFTYAGAAILFHLDTLKQNDILIVYWQGKEYDYKVNAIKIVSPLDVSVEQDTTQPKLTLYTCTPLWTSKERLVVTAEPYEAAP